MKVLKLVLNVPGREYACPVYETVDEIMSEVDVEEICDAVNSWERMKLRAVIETDLQEF